MGSSRAHLEALLAPADIRVNGDRPWDLQVHDNGVFDAIMAQGTLGAGETYMDAKWDCEALDELASRILQLDLASSLNRGKFLWAHLRARFLNRQAKNRAGVVGQVHYDKGNDLYRAMLDPLMVYSCGYWKEAANLADAQLAKLDLIARKLGLQAGQKVLDIGCGWGGAARFFAERYGVEVVGCTISSQQSQLAREQVKGFPVEIVLEDYREMTGENLYDHVYSIGMFEHVGPRNYPVYFDTARRLLKDDGLFLLHTIGHLRPGLNGDPWIDKYIFPGGVLPTVDQIAAACRERFIIEDWHNFGPDYDRTLMAWYANFEAAWPQLQARYDERFRRMWRFYLLTCAGNFRARKAQLWQVVLSPKGTRQAYRAPR